jgi:HSP20 family protein
MVRPLPRSARPGSVARGDPFARSLTGAITRATMRGVAFTRWDPLRDLIALHEHLGQLVGSDAPGWTPPVDLYETPTEFVLTAELPGLPRDQIEIHAEEGRILIRGERIAGAGRDIPCEQYHRVERGHGRFSRAFALPEPIDVNRVAADLKDGILTVTIPKAAERGVRKINVS